MSSENRSTSSTDSSADRGATPTGSPPVGDESVITQRTILEEDAARKRREIGLNERRPTARPVVQRPPKDRFSLAQRWLLTVLLFGVLAVTVLLVFAEVSGAPTSWSALRTYSQALLRGEPWPNLHSATSPGNRYQLRYTDEFDSRTGLVACTQQAGEWISDVDPERGIYFMQLWPGRVTWSTIALRDASTNTVPPYYIDASTNVADIMPDGYVGFIGRYQDPDNFYLFMIDGRSRYQIQLWHNGKLTTLQPWTESLLINQAGFENILALEDNGTRLEFFANNQPLATVSTPVLPMGEGGLLGGSGEKTMAEVQVDWLRVYDVKY